MGMFDKLFGASSDANKNTSKSADETPWVELQKMEQLDEIVEESNSKVQFIFKHSTRCGVSRMVISQFKKSYDLSEDQATLYYLDLLNHRNISQAIAERFGVRHESPQLLILKDGKVIANDSHGAINQMRLETYL